MAGGVCPHQKRDRRNFPQKPAVSGATPCYKIVVAPKPLIQATLEREIENYIKLLLLYSRLWLSKGLSISLSPAALHVAKRGTPAKSVA
jgi:hypothetical protein